MNPNFGCDKVSLHQHIQDYSIIVIRSRRPNGASVPGNLLFLIQSAGISGLYVYICIYIYTAIPTKHAQTMYPIIRSPVPVYKLIL